MTEVTAVKRIIVLLLVIACLLCGCRVRLVEDVSLADTVIRPETEPPTEAPTEPPTEESSEPPTEPPTQEPTEAPTDAPTEAPTEPPRQTQATSGASPSGGKAETPPAQEADPLETEPAPTEPEPETEPSEEPETEPAETLFTVTFDGNGHHVKGPSDTLEWQLPAGVPYGTLPTPPFEGYTFLGWFTAAEDGEQVFPETPFPGESLTLYAHWQYDPVQFWRFTLQNRTQQVYLCQQVAVYFETVEPNLTQSNCALISDTGGWNIASGRDDPLITDDWVLAKNPAVIVKCVESFAEAESVRAEILSRFPGRRVFLVSADALGSGAAGLYARLSLAKALYGDWYLDVDLSAVAAELGVETPPIQ